MSKCSDIEDTSCWDVDIPEVTGEEWGGGLSGASGAEDSDFDGF